MVYQPRHVASSRYIVDDPPGSKGQRVQRVKQRGGSGKPHTFTSVVATRPVS